MILKRKILMILLLCFPLASVAADYDINKLIQSISNASSIDDAIGKYNAALATVESNYPNVSENVKKQFREQEGKKMNTMTNPVYDETESDDVAESGEETTSSNSIETNSVNNNEKNENDLEKKKQAYEDAKAKEQSKANRMLTAATVAATGIGGMELAQGLAEQKADKAAEQDMSAYIATFRCSYAKGKSVKAGPEEIELPGGNSTELMGLRNEYFSLAKDLKERKTALGMKPGIESEEILDKTELSLYDEENIGITEGAYSSLYRAKMLGSEKDQEQIDADKKTSKNRVIGGGVAAGAGVVGGVVGDSLINGKLGEKIKENQK